MDETGTSTPIEVGIKTQVNPVLPLAETLKSTRESITNIEIVEGRGPDEKSALLDSAIGILLDCGSPHLISISAYLIRELLTRFTKDSSKPTAVQDTFECQLYDHNVFPAEEFQRIQSVSNSKFSFQLPNKIIWQGVMEDAERDDLLTYSRHPFWKDAVYAIYEAKKINTGNRHLNNTRIQNFLDQQKTKFTLSTNDYPAIISQINLLIDTGHRMVHDPRRYRLIGEILVSNNPTIPADLQQNFKDFEEFVSGFGSLMENFKLKPIGRLDQLDEIIHE